MLLVRLPPPPLNRNFRGLARLNENSKGCAPIPRSNFRGIHPQAKILGVYRGFATPKTPCYCGGGQKALDEIHVSRDCGNSPLVHILIVGVTCCALFVQAWQRDFHTYGKARARKVRATQHTGELRFATCHGMRPPTQIFTVVVLCCIFVCGTPFLRCGSSKIQPYHRQYTKIARLILKVLPRGSVSKVTHPGRVLITPSVRYTQLLPWDIFEIQTSLPTKRVLFM